MTVRLGDLPEGRWFLGDDCDLYLKVMSLGACAACVMHNLYDGTLKPTQLSSEVKVVPIASDRNLTVRAVAAGKEKV